MRSIRINEYGGPDMMRLEEVDLPAPGPGEVRVMVRAAGVNFVDVYHRKGLYAGHLPYTPGSEVGGEVHALGDGVEGLAVGDPVVSARAEGAYADYAIVPAWKLVPIPAGVNTMTATAAALQGMTAHYLVHDTYPIRPGDTVLVHAAAGGVGLLLVQMAKLRGARVIGTVSTEEKAQLARERGADEVILYTERDFQAEVKRLTDGRGVRTVYDSVGRDTFDKSLNCLQPRGMMVLYGQSSGPVPPVDPQVLNQKGSLFLTRPSLGHYAASREEIQSRMNDIFRWIQAGDLTVRIDKTFPLEEAAEAHRYLEARQTRGKVLLGTQQGRAKKVEELEKTIDRGDIVDQSSWESFPASDPPPYPGTQV